MSSSKRTTTDAFHQGVFKPHGRMQLEQSGQLNILEANGPFNLELVIAADKAQEGFYEALAKNGRWGTVLIFRESAMASLEAVAEITKILVKRKDQGYVPAAIALVINPDVEGGNLMKTLYLNAYRSAGIEGRIFENEELAKEWVASVIDGQSTS